VIRYARRGSLLAHISLFEAVGNDPALPCAGEHVAAGTALRDEGLGRLRLGFVRPPLLLRSSARASPFALLLLLLKLRCTFACN